MTELQVARMEDRVPDTVLLLEHDPVITIGRGGDGQNILVPTELLRLRGVDVVETGRGGDVTLHAPGQLVCYPIVKLSPDRQDVRRYVGNLTDTMRGLAADHGIASGPVEKLIGLWVDRAAPSRWEGASAARTLAKIGAVGVRISRWVTMHGFAFNLTTDLELFGLIVPCGIRDHGVTSVLDLTGTRPDVQRSAERALELVARELFAAVVALSDVSSKPLAEGLAALRR